jgi:membrane protease YdiL (CAAX protease family)
MPELNFITGEYMKNIKKLWFFGLLILPGLVFASINVSPSTEKNTFRQSHAVLVAANDQADVKSAQEDKTSLQESTAPAQPEKEDSKVVFFAGFLVMGALLAYVLYKSKDLGK